MCVLCERVCEPRTGAPVVLVVVVALPRRLTYIREYIAKHIYIYQKEKHTSIYIYVTTNARRKTGKERKGKPSKNN